LSLTLEQIGRRAPLARRFFSPRRFQRPGLTAVRAVAALMVLAFHLHHYVEPRRLGLGPFDVTPLVTIGWAGVNVFFVLSGFLITLHLAERLAGRAVGAAYLPYLRDRVLRVVPAYWAQIGVLFAVAWLATGAWPAWAPHVPAHLVFLQNLSPEGHAAINGVYWSLPVEFAFYLVAPFLAAWAWSAPDEAALRRRALALALAGVVACVAWRAFAIRQVPEGAATTFWWTAAHLPGNADAFALGAAAALLYGAAGWPDAAHEPRWSRRGDALLVLGLAGGVGALYLLDALVEGYWSGTWIFYAWGTLLALAVALAVFGIAVGGRIARTLFENAPIVWLGAVSYSLYLWHPVLLTPLAAALDARAGGFLDFAWKAVPPIVAVAALSYYLVERPFLRIKGGSEAVPRTLQ
jgi:peptidoglycan/LPS O-acetylase OafA/YrhL